MSSTIINRKALYVRVWAEPMLRVAKEFGLSDVGLAKICRKHKIPHPSRGYWARREAGQSPGRTPLPNPDNDPSITIRASNDSPRVVAIDDEFQQLIEDQYAKPFQIDVRDHLRGAHPLVSDANQLLQSTRPNSDGLILLSGTDSIDLRISKLALRRSLFIVDALLRAFATHGDNVSAGPCVRLLDVDVRFTVLESLSREREEIGCADLSGRYEFNHSRYQSVLIPSGRLTLQIKGSSSYWNHNCRQNWRDTPRHPLEQRLEEVIAGLFDYAATIRREEKQRQSEQEARAATERQRQEAAKQRAARRAVIQAERERVESLITNSKQWKKSQALREYIDAVRHQYVDRNGSIEPGSQMAEWLEWATQQADRMDPFVESPPSILDEVVEEEPKNDRSFGYR